MNILVLKIGGSLLYNDDLAFNTSVIRKISTWYKEQEMYDKCVLVVGGGKISRFVVNQVRNEISEDSARHRVGMKMTQVNAAIVHGMIKGEGVEYFDCSQDIIENIERSNLKVAVTGGTKIGGSSDIIAAEIASNLKISYVNKVSNIDYVYSGDPNLNKNVTPLETLTWDQYKELFGEIFKDGHQPGMNIPIDFGCADFCSEHGIKFRVTGGKNLHKVDIDEVLTMGTIVG